MTLTDRITKLREANPENIYELDTVTRSIYLLVPIIGVLEANAYISTEGYTGILVYTESETEAY